MNGCRCHGCKERTLGCHGWCESYKEFLAENERERKARARARAIDDWSRRGR